MALLIDAKNEAVASWYASYGALQLLDTPLTLLLPLATIKIALETTGRLLNGSSPIPLAAPCSIVLR